MRHKVTKAIGSKPSASKSKAQRFRLHFFSFLWNVSSRAAPFACKSLAILRGVCHHAFHRGVWFCPERDNASAADPTKIGPKFD